MKKDKEAEKKAKTVRKRRDKLEKAYGKKFMSILREALYINAKKELEAIIACADKEFGISEDSEPEEGKEIIPVNTINPFTNEKMIFYIKQNKEGDTLRHNHKPQKRSITTQGGNSLKI